MTDALAPSPRPDKAVITLIIPCRDEEDAIAPFMARVRPALTAIEGCDFRFLFINDGSNDDTLPRLAALAAEDKAVEVVDLSRNFGKEAALTAGLDLAEGDAVIPIDIDLQDPPELIADFVAKWREGFDMVYGVRRSRAADDPARRITARGFYRIFNRFSETPIPEDAGDFRLMDRVVVEAIKRLPERNRFMKGLVAWVGYASTAIVYDRPARETGESKFNLSKLWNFALDGVVGFSSLPIKIWTYVGLVFATIAILYAIALVLRTFIWGIDVPGYASIMVAVLVSAGMQMISIGLLGEYVGRLFIEAKQRPVYIVRRVISARGRSEDSAAKR